MCAPWHQHLDEAAPRTPRGHSAGTPLPHAAPARRACARLGISILTRLRPEPHAGTPRGPHCPTPRPRGAHVRAANPDSHCHFRHVAVGQQLRLGRVADLVHRHPRSAFEQLKPVCRHLNDP